MADFGQELHRGFSNGTCFKGFRDKDFNLKSGFRV